MEHTPIAIDLSAYPAAFHTLLSGARLFDSSSTGHSGATTIFIDKDDGYFLKSAPRGTLAQQAAMTRFLHGKGLAAEVLAYESAASDWLLTARVPGEDCTAAMYLEQPERLADILAEQLYDLHHTDFTGCPSPNQTEAYLALAKHNYQTGRYDKSLFPDNWGYDTAEEAYAVLENRSHCLQTDTLIHGDYCLPNIILDNWRFSGFIDVDGGGIGDRHIDLFWGIWSLWFNTKSDRYRERFINAYGKADVDEERLRIVAAAEVFG